MTANETIIGGMFGEEDVVKTEQGMPCFLEGRHLKLFNARSGLYILCKLLKPKRIWLPAYICRVLVEAIPDGSDVQFYPISENLRISNIKWIEGLGATDLVVFIDYFGFNLHSDIIEKVKPTGAQILQDAAQALLSDFERPYADYIIYSPRKFIGVPDGGILEIKTDLKPADDLLKSPPDDVEIISQRALSGRTIFDRSGSGEWFADFQKAETMHRAGQFKMSCAAQKILFKGLDYTDICRQRRTNFEYLLNKLGNISIIRSIAPDEVPLGFPIFVEDRDAIRSALIKKSIFCPIHWDQSEIIPNTFHASHMLSKHILTLICDQRVTLQQLEEMIRIVRNYL